MTYQINNPEMYDAICALYNEFITLTTARDLSMNYAIVVSPKMAKELDIGPFLTIEGNDFIEDVPVVVKQVK